MDLKLNDNAPNFKQKNQNNEIVNLSDHKGKWVVLYFYPKDMTPGCTKEACDFTDNHEKLNDMNTIIMGVSPDTVVSHQKFVKKEKITFLLLADEDHSIASQYNVWALKKMYGKEYYGVVRSTFLIDPHGKIAFIWKKVKVENHVQEVIDKVALMQKNYRR